MSVAGLKAKGQQHPSGPNYFVARRRLVVAQEHPRRIGPGALTNFVARIVGEVVRDDGVETVRQFEIEATVNGQVVRFTLPAGDFAGMGWATKELGGKALVYPGQGTKDHARFAIQLLSPPYEVRRVFAHTGWREIDGKPAYLHGGGAITAQGLASRRRDRAGQPA